MALTRQDRINLHKKRDGISIGKGTVENLVEGIPQFRTETDHETGEYKIVHYIKNGPNIFKSEFIDADTVKSAYTSSWYLSDEVDLTSTGVSKCLKIPPFTYLLDVRVLVTEVITAGSMDVDVGDATNADMFIDGWDGTSGSVGGNTILSFGQAASATEAGQKTGKYYEDADSLDIDVNVVAGAGKIRLLALLLQNPIGNPVNP